MFVASQASYPDNEIVVCADDDHSTKAIRLTKAREAALEINAGLAVPDFGETRGKETDFNDLHQVKGLEQLKQQLI